MDKIWLKSYPKGISTEINPDSYPSLGSLFDEACERFSEDVAYQNFGETLTFRQLQQKVSFFAAFLQKKCGLKKGDRLAIMIPNLLQHPIILFAALKLGLIVVNVNPMYTPRELQFQLKDSGARLIVVLENFAHTVEAVKKDVTLEHVIVAKIGDVFSPLKRFIVNSVNRYVKQGVPPYKLPQKITFRKALKLGARLSFQPETVQGSDIAFLQYTGGTTGIPKGAILTHRNMVANVEQASAWVRPILGEKEIVITALPLYHIFALTANCLVFLRCGAKNIFITNPRDIPSFIQQIKGARFTILSGVNTLFNALLNDPKFKTVDFSGLKITLGGGMAVQKAVAERWLTATGTPLIEAYGLTESSPAICINPLDNTAFNGSVGLPVPSTELKIMDDEGMEVPLGSVGELWVRGPQVSQGYWHHPEETQKTFTEDGWLRTGDLGVIDECGYVKIVDRKKDMILVSGFNVFPNEVEEVLVTHPGVREAAVIGVPDEHGVEHVKAFIVPSDPHLTVDEVLTFARQQLTSYKVPKLIEFRSELPKSNVGKILRRVLRDSEKSPS